MRVAGRFCGFLAGSESAGACCEGTDGYCEGADTHCGAGRASGEETRHSSPGEDKIGHLFSIGMLRQTEPTDWGRLPPLLMRGWRSCEANTGG